MLSVPQLTPQTPQEHVVCVRVDPTVDFSLLRLVAVLVRLTVYLRTEVTVIGLS